MKKGNWTDNEVHILHEELSRGTSLKEIGRLLSKVGYSRISVLLSQQYTTASKA